MAAYTLKGIDNDLWKRIKAMAALEGISIKQLIILSLEKALKEYEDMPKSGMIGGFDINTLKKEEGD